MGGQAQAAVNTLLHQNAERTLKMRHFALCDCFRSTEQGGGLGDRRDTRKSPALLRATQVTSGNLNFLHFSLRILASV